MENAEYSPLLHTDRPNSPLAWKYLLVGADIALCIQLCISLLTISQTPMLELITLAPIFIIVNTIICVLKLFSNASMIGFLTCVITQKLAMIGLCTAAMMLDTRYHIAPIIVSIILYFACTCTQFLLGCVPSYMRPTWENREYVPAL